MVHLHIGYDGLFKKKVAEDAKDGCALFYKTSRFARRIAHPIPLP